MKIKGTVKKVFCDKNDGYMIFTLIVEDKSMIPLGRANPNFPKSVTVAGNIYGVEEKDAVILDGDWQKLNGNGDFWPWRFIPQSYEICDFEDRQSMISYLSNLPDVSKDLATKIVTSFEERTSLIVEQYYMKLTEIDGIDAVKAKEIHDNYLLKREFKMLLRFFKKYELTVKEIQMFQDRHPTQAMKTISENPYSISNDEIISFKKADAIAKDMNFTATDIMRMEAAVNSVLNIYAAGRGHSYLEYDNLVNSTEKFLLKNSAIPGDVSAKQIEEFIKQFKNNHTLYIEGGKVYSTPRYKNENDVARIIAYRTNMDSPFKNISMELIIECLDKVEVQLGFQLAEKQRESVITSVKNSTVVITGGPGTGKTTTLFAIVKTMDLICEKTGMRKLSHCLAAPTGKAAKRMSEKTGISASTIHKLLNYNPFMPEKIKSEKDPIVTDVLIIDELSMVDIDMMGSLMRAVTNNTIVIFVGDADQLFSIGPGNVLSDLISSEVLPTVKLERAYRQKGKNTIYENGVRINNGALKLETDPREFVFMEVPDTEEDTECTRLLSMIERVYFEEYKRNGCDVNKVQILSPVRAKTKVSTTSLNAKIQSVINPKINLSDQITFKDTIFRKNDKITQLKNNYDKFVFNGEMGIVKEVFPKKKELLIEFQNGACELKKYEKSELNQLDHGYASTIHQSQGQEFSVVIIALSNHFQKMLFRNLLFTGVTRAEKKVIIVGDRNALDYAIMNVSNKKRLSQLSEKLKLYKSKYDKAA